MNHQPLPSRKNKVEMVRGPEATAPSSHPAAPVVAEGRTAAASVNVNGKHAYVVKIRMKGSTLAGLCFLTHHKKFSQVEVDAMISEACKVVNEIRLPARRQQMAKERTPVHEPQKINETWFESDVMFIEAVLADKYQFTVLRVTSSESEIEPAIKVQNP